MAYTYGVNNVNLLFATFLKSHKFI